MSFFKFIFKQILINFSQKLKIDGTMIGLQYIMHAMKATMKF